MIVDFRTIPYKQTTFVKRFQTIFVNILDYPVIHLLQTPTPTPTQIRTLLRRQDIYKKICPSHLHEQRQINYDFR